MVQMSFGKVTTGRGSEMKIGYARIKLLPDPNFAGLDPMLLAVPTYRIPC